MARPSQRASRCASRCASHLQGKGRRAAAANHRSLSTFWARRTTGPRAAPRLRPEAGRGAARREPLRPPASRRARPGAAQPGERDGRAPAAAARETWKGPASRSDRERSGPTGTRCALQRPVKASSAASRHSPGNDGASKSTSTPSSAKASRVSDWTRRPPSTGGSGSLVASTGYAWDVKHTEAGRERCMIPPDMEGLTRQACSASPGGHRCYRIAAPSRAREPDPRGSPAAGLPRLPAP